MLVLTRRVSELVLITTPEGDEIQIMLTGIDGRQAKIGINAPLEYTVHRDFVKPPLDPRSRA